MVKYVRDVFSIRSTWALFLLSLFSILLTVVRAAVTGRSMFLFLWWNLFLAFIPWSIATFVRVRNIQNRWLLAVLLLCWIVFFPNAPYILTDLIHLQDDRSAPLWFDMMLLLSFGFLGMYYGFVSLHLLETRFQRRLPGLWAGAASVVLIYLACFGIYLGRFLRWNSWDLVDNLGRVMSDIYQRLADPFDHRETWGFTVLFGTFLNLAYWCFKTFSGDVRQGGNGA
jgi:uncharacterized membrane protein